MLVVVVVVVRRTMVDTVVVAVVVVVAGRTLSFVVWRVKDATRRPKAVARCLVPGRNVVRVGKVGRSVGGIFHVGSWNVHLTVLVGWLVAWLVRIILVGEVLSWVALRWVILGWIILERVILERMVGR